MKVYACMSDKLYGIVVAVYSTRERAEQEMRERAESNRMYQKTGEFTRYFRQPIRAVEEWEVQE